MTNDCGISPAWDPDSGGTPPQLIEFAAIWDTGATNSVVTQNVIDACGLVATGMTKVQGVHSVEESETYLVNIALPGKVVFTGMRVTKGKFTGGDILIGMDIINQGDFAVTNQGGATKFSFRVPSQVHIDFVEEINKANEALRPLDSRAERRRAKFGRR